MVFVYFRVCKKCKKYIVEYLNISKKFLFTITCFEIFSKQIWKTEYNIKKNNRVIKIVYFFRRFFSNGNYILCLYVDYKDDVVICLWGFEIIKKMYKK